MEFGYWARAALWLACVLLIGSVELTLLDNTRKGVSKENSQNIVLNSPQSNRRRNNLHKHSVEHLTRDKHSSKPRKLKKRDGFVSGFKRESDLNHKVIARSFHAGGKSRGQFPAYLQQATENDIYQRRSTHPDQFNPANLRERWDANALEESEDGLIKRSRNRVRLKSQRSDLRKMETRQNSVTVKQDVSKGSANGILPKEIKRQQIFNGFINTGRPIDIANDNPQEISNEGMRLDENPESFFANPVTANPGIRAFKPSHFYAPAVHKFLPVEHRYPSPPIHKYLSSPVIFRGNGESEALMNGAGYSMDSRQVAGPERHFKAGPQPFFQGSTHQGQRVIVVNRPFHSPFPVPVPGPPRVVLMHHPVALPPHRVPVPLMEHGPRPPQFVIVHHREFSGPGTFVYDHFPNFQRLFMEIQQLLFTCSNGDIMAH